MPGTEIELEFTDPLGRTVCTLGFVEYPAIGQRRDDPVLLVSYRVQYRLRLGPQHPGHIDPPVPLADIPLPSDFREDRVMVMFNDDTEDLEHRPHGLVLPGQDVKQCIALLFGGTTLQNGLHAPLSVMNRPGEIERGRDDQAVQIDTTTLAFGDPESNGPGAIAVGRRGIGLARTAKVTTAKLDVLRLNRPLSNCHHTSPLDWFLFKRKYSPLQDRPAKPGNYDL